VIQGNIEVAELCSVKDI